jgi:hypothetical protein
MTRGIYAAVSGVKKHLSHDRLVTPGGDGPGLSLPKRSEAQPCIILQKGACLIDGLVNGLANGLNSELSMETALPVVLFMF